MPQDKVVEYLNQLYDISKIIQLNEVPNYIKQKLEAKEKIDQEIKEANDVLQSKNANIEVIDEYLRLKEALDQRGLSTQDMDKLLTLLDNAKENGFDTKKIVSKLRGVTRLEKKHDRLRKNCEILSTQVKECNKILPLAQKIVAMDIDISGLLVFDTAVNEIAGRFNLPPSVAAHRLIGDIRDYKKIVNIKEELEKLSLQKYALIQACSHQALRALGKMQHGAIS